MNRQNWNGKKILVLGAARQGLALARYLSSHGANIVLNDYKSPDLFLVDLQPLQDLGVEMVFGSHPVELLNGIDLLCLSAGIPLSLPIVQQAVYKGIPLSNDSQIFMEAVPCRTIGITGSAGKTTTTTLVGRMAEVGHPAKVWVGGNIGLPLITFVDQMQPEDLVVMELSSFQLDQMTISPDIAAVLNITPNHLDRHGTMQAYIEAKSQILLHQSASNVAVLNRDDPGAWSLAGSVVGSLVTFGFNRPQGEYHGTSFDQGWVWLSTGINEEQLMPREMIMLKGDHNVSNVLAACAIAHAAGITAEAMVNGVAGFSGVPHRLELVRILHGVAWYNDSIATAPERTMAALRSFQEPVVLLLGGRDKNLPW
ncbi:MAG TPA: UDP-N-acetylmuramoyl-L-alanine--D-glutamate ligase, partial [Anaerolineaceae bacterium]|nr:UDP-N-acetylmuramoyl-L-alanine--D-glutamate ligase [Anaerolineaceae bacterium]